jgi:DNA-binding transcriptional LysR family regulator
MLAGIRDAGLQIDRSFFAQRCDNHTVNWHALCAGGGIGVATSAMSATRPELVRVMPDQPLPSLPVWLVAHAELRASQRLKVEFDFLAREIAALPH